MRALVVKGQNILLRTRTLRPDDAVEPVHHQNRTKRGSRSNGGEHLFALITQVFCKDHSHPWKTDPCDFHPDRSGGHVVPRWKSPDVMVRVSLEWKSPQVLGGVNSGENPRTLWLVWVRVKITPRYGKSEFFVSLLSLDIVKIDKTPLIYSFHISIWRAWSIVWGGLACQNPLWRQDWPYLRHESQYQCRGQPDCPAIVVKHLPILGRFTLGAWFS